MPKRCWRCTHRLRWASSPISATADHIFYHGGTEDTEKADLRDLRVSVGNFQTWGEAMAFGDLTTLDDVKAWLQTGQNPFPATDDVLLTGLVTAASGFIER